ncbi:conserved hypothetical protein [Alteromonas macleodii]
MLGAHLGKLNHASRALPKARSVTQKKDSRFMLLCSALI